MNENFLSSDKEIRMKQKQNKNLHENVEIKVVPEVGLEPTRYCYRQILSLMRLPFRHSGIFILTKVILSYTRLSVNLFPKEIITMGRFTVSFLKNFQNIQGSCVILIRLLNIFCHAHGNHLFYPSAFSEQLKTGKR